MKNIGFIGMGNMAQAIADGLLSRGLLKKEQVFAYAPNAEKLAGNAERIGFTACASAEEVCEKSDYIVMACKPQQALENAEKLKEALKGKALLSIAWGLDFAAYSAVLAEDTRIQFIMPNTPAQVGEGVYLFEEENGVEIKEIEYDNARNEAEKIFGKLKVEDIEKKHFDKLARRLNSLGYSAGTITSILGEYR